MASASPSLVSAAICRTMAPRGIRGGSNFPAALAGLFDSAAALAGATAAPGLAVAPPAVLSAPHAAGVETVQPGGGLDSAEVDFAAGSPRPAPRAWSRPIT